MHTVQCNEYLFIYFSNHPARTNRFSQLRSVRCCTASIDRSIELQATGVGPFHPSFRHSPTLPTSRPSTLYSFLCFLPSVTLYITYNIYIYILLSRSSSEGRAIRIPFPSNYNSSPFQSDGSRCAHLCRQERIISFLFEDEANGHVSIRGEWLIGGFPLSFSSGSCSRCCARVFSFLSFFPSIVFQSIFVYSSFDF